MPAANRPTVGSPWAKGIFRRGWFASKNFVADIDAFRRERTRVECDEARKYDPWHGNCRACSTPMHDCSEGRIDPAHSSALDAEHLLSEGIQQRRR